MKKNLAGLLFFSSLIFLYNCQSPDLTKTPSSSKTESPKILTSPSPQSTQPTPSPEILTLNYLDRNSSSSAPICQNANVTTGYVYTNKENSSFYGNWIGSINEYFDYIKNEVPLEGVSISYGDKILKSNKDGSFNIPKDNNLSGYKVSFQKEGYYPLGIAIENKDCLFHVGLSPLFESELSAEGGEYKNYSFQTEYNKTEYPEYFIKHEKGFGYFIVKDEEQFNKIKNSLTMEDTEKENLAKLISNKKEMIILFSPNTSIFGIQPYPIDSVMENENNVILSTHKGKYINFPLTFSPSPMGDTFSILVQAISIPYTEKKLLFNLPAISFEI